MNPKALSYLKGLKRIEKEAICKRSGISIRWLQNMMYAGRLPSPDVAKALEKATFGELTREDLRPDINWDLIK